MTFRTAEPALKDVLDAIARGETQLPDFQRGWVWDDQHIRSLIASLSLSYPIGAVMFLEAGGAPFKPRLFEGVSLTPVLPPRKLVLDGQQRLTSMYLALRSGKPVPRSSTAFSRRTVSPRQRYGLMTSTRSSSGVSPPCLA